jgi:hypothetical protein
LSRGKGFRYLGSNFIVTNNWQKKKTVCATTVNELTGEAYVIEFMDDGEWHEYLPLDKIRKPGFYYKYKSMVSV